MNRINFFKKAVMSIALMGMTLSFAACSDDKDEPDPNQLDNTKTAIINQYVNGVVIPTYRSLADEASELAELCDELRNNPTQGKLNECCESWISARKYWELSEAFLFGAAADYNINSTTFWPTTHSSRHLTRMVLLPMLLPRWAMACWASTL